MCTTTRRYCQRRPRWCGVCFAARLQRNLGHLEHGPHTGGWGPRPGREAEDTLTEHARHAELVAGIRGLHVVAGDILRVVAASAQLLSALVKKVNRILARRAALRRLDYLITQCTKVTICMANNEKRSFFTRYHIQTQ